MSGGLGMINKMVGKLSAGRGPLLVLAGILLLGGCQAVGERAVDRSAFPASRAPTASRVFYSHRITFGARETALNDGESKRLTNFIDKMRISDSDMVYLVAGDNSLRRYRMRAVAKFLAARNIQVGRPPAGSKDGGAPGGTIDVVVGRYVVTLPGCPDWSGQRFTYDNVPTSNWGCASAVNLGRMVARPEDLARGRNPGWFDGEYGARSIGLYRNGNTKPLIQEGVGPIKSQPPAASQTTGQPSTGTGG